MIKLVVYNKNIYDFHNFIVSNVKKKVIVVGGQSLLSSPQNLNLLCFFPQNKLGLEFLLRENPPIKRKEHLKNWQRVRYVVLLVAG